jgi:hypothetical protein
MIATRSEIKANKRGYDDTRCQEGLIQASTCICSPAGPEALVAGDWLDFTFGAGPTQEGFLVSQIKRTLEKNLPGAMYTRQIRQILY